MTIYNNEYFFLEKLLIQLCDIINSKIDYKNLSNHSFPNGHKKIMKIKFFKEAL